MVTLHGREVHPDDTLMYKPPMTSIWIPVRAGEPDVHWRYETHISYIKIYPRTHQYRWPDLRDYVKQVVDEVKP